MIHTMTKTPDLNYLKKHGNKLRYYLFSHLCVSTQQDKCPHQVHNNNVLTFHCFLCFLSQLKSPAMISSMTGHTGSVKLTRDQRTG